jgi:hypothetical protein
MEAYGGTAGEGRYNRRDESDEQYGPETIQQSPFEG